MHLIEHVIQRFPDRAKIIRRLYLRDERFRAICEDMEMAVASLKRFEARPDAVLRPEVDEYRHVLVELEEELRDYLSHHGRNHDDG
ncbi:hypothetical protein [Paracoccus litorisediminis]|jgi:hypothetical protein|uniref:Uncharacterized protein n=1 Tax=Paracoccus litorisediminis TaxID=2006130 RepID=A0A844HRG8_9RHOB|nr:hypothetical protein [Paracoccus litorisediminis]MTH61658.1 hypothetical protein [Paracoccus litorisediminis]